MVCPCCQPPEFQCCCVGISPLTDAPPGTSNYRRIEVIPYGDECDGTLLTYSNDNTTCEGRTILVEWCDMSVEVVYESPLPAETINPGTSAGACGTVIAQTLQVQSLPAGNFQPLSGLRLECGRCVFRYMVSLQQNTFECGTLTKNYIIDWREGCDSEVHVEFWASNSDAALYSCNDDPVVTTTLAP